MVGLPSANAVVLGDPVELDERCSLEARSPDLRHFRAFFPGRAPGLAGFGFFLLPSRIHARSSPLTQTVGRPVQNEHHLENQ